MRHLVMPAQVARENTQPIERPSRVSYLLNDMILSACAEGKTYILVSLDTHALHNFSRTELENLEQHLQERRYATERVRSSQRSMDAPEDMLLVSWKDA